MDTTFGTKSMTRDEEDTRKLQAETLKIMAETAKFNAEVRWYPFIAGAGLFAAAAAFLKLLDTFF